MTWSFDHKAHKIYQRNPLVSTDIEIRFHPVLKIALSDELNDFQDIIRKSFPKFRQASIRTVAVNDHGLEVNDQQQFQFTTTKGCHSVYLAQESLRVGSSNHHNREDLIDHFVFALEALEKVFGQMSYVRIGVRYINKIKLYDIAKDLGQHTLDWTDLIKEAFLAAPAGLANNKQMNFSNSYASNIEGKDGYLGLKYSLSQGRPDVADNFTLDIDRFSELSGGISDAKNLLLDYTLDIYSLFETVANDDLRKWMDTQ